MEQTLTFKRIIHVPPAEVYRAFVHATALRDWLCHAAQADARPGGRLYLWMRGGFYATGEFVKLEPGKKLVFTWLGRGEPAPTRVRVSFDAHADGTRLTLKHEQVGSGVKWNKTIQEISAGWTESLENLQSVLETGIDLREARLPRLGILIGEFNAEIAAKLGAPVKAGIRLEGTAEGTSARAAGLQKDDVIVKLGGKQAVDFPTLNAALQGRHAGDQVQVAFYRGSRKMAVTMDLGARPVPQVPATAAELAEIVRRNYAEINAQVTKLLAGVSESEAAHRPAPEAWSLHELVAHFIACERDFQSWVADMLNDNVVGDSMEYRPNVNERLRVMVARYGTLAALMDELVQSQAETAALLAALPATFVARKHLYRRVAAWMTLYVPVHYREEHWGQMQAALQSARNAASPLPRDTADLLDRIRREWAALEHVYAGLSDEQMTRPGAEGWSVKDHLAHLTAWEQFMLAHHLQGRPAHEVLEIDAATLKTLDENGENAILRQRSQGQSVAQVLAGRQQSLAQVMATLEQTPFAALMQPHLPDDPQARPLILRITGNTYEHYQEHRAYIQAVIEYGRTG